MVHCGNSNEQLKAGTDASANIWLTGTNGVTVGPMVIHDTGKDLMERNCANELNINLATHLGPLYKLSIQHDGKGTLIANDAWHLDRVELAEVNLATNETVPSKSEVFKFEKWLKDRVYHVS